VEQVTRYSDKLLIEVLRAKHPDFKSQPEVVVNNAVATGLLIVPSDLSVEDWSKQAEAQQARYALGNDGEPALLPPPPRPTADRQGPIDTGPSPVTIHRSS